MKLYMKNRAALLTLFIHVLVAVVDANHGVREGISIGNRSADRTRNTVVNVHTNAGTGTETETGLFYPISSKNISKQIRSRFSQESNQPSHTSFKSTSRSSSIRLLEENVDSGQNEETDFWDFSSWDTVKWIVAIIIVSAILACCCICLCCFGCCSLICG